MKLSGKTIDILKSMKDINPSILIKHDVVPPYVDLKGNTIIGTLSPTKKIIAFARIEENFEYDIAIYDGGKFLTAMSLFKDPNIEITEKRLTIKSAESSLDFTFCSQEAILSPPFEWNTKPDYTDGSFILHQSHVAELVKASSVIGAPDITFEGDGEVVRVTAEDVKNPSSHKYTTIIDTCETVFKVWYKIDSLKLFPANYTVSMVAGNSLKALRLKNDDFEIFLAPMTEAERNR